MEGQEPYELTLNVTNEQEEAIKAFFARSGWDYIKVGKYWHQLFVCTGYAAASLDPYAFYTVLSPESNLSLGT